MKLPRNAKGGDLVKALCRDWDYRIVHQEGSHVIPQTEFPSPQRIPIPNHNPIRIGTLNSILRLVARHKGVETRRYPALALKAERKHESGLQTGSSNFSALTVKAFS
jgi:predicted RNA binding protein YcfA (HicA-like mRNA interferase family)